MRYDTKSFFTGRFVVAILLLSGFPIETVPGDGRAESHFSSLPLFRRSLTGSFSCPPSKVARTSNTTASNVQARNAGQDMSWQDMSCSRPFFSSVNKDEQPRKNLTSEGWKNLMTKDWKEDALSQGLFSKCEPIRLKTKKSPVLLRKLNSLELSEAKQSKE